MRALFVCQPAYGHFHPLVPLATACEDEGHDVAFVVAPSFVPVVEAAGFEALPAGLDWLESAPEAAFPETAAMGIVELGDFLFNRIFLEHAAAAMAGDLPGAFDSWGPDVVVHEGTEFGTVLAADMVEVPRVTVITDAAWPPQSLAPFFAPTLDRVRADLGLAPDPHLERLASCLHLACYPPYFQLSPTPQSWYPDLRPLRPVPYDGPTPPVELPRHGDRPLVLVTLGTVFAKRAGDVLQAVLDGLAQEDVDVVTALGADKWVPVGAGARQADVVVGHGGWGTTMATLVAGKPSLVLPQAGDQFSNAFRVEASGAGLRLLAHAVDPGTVRRAVRELLDDPLYFANAQRLRRSIEAMPGPAELVPVLTALT
ncbi:MAG TPA: glycosyltransferase [Acidimicrobiales bacterium]|nr:glycosyltransferase [Acidimicrobiales bacterium]